MGFPSPAKDYIETPLTVESLCHVDANCLVIETTGGYAVIDRSLRAEQGDMVLINHCSRNQFAKLMGKALITDDGESLEGEALDDVDVAGVVTYTVHDLRRKPDEELPVI